MQTQKFFCGESGPRLPAATRYKFHLHFVERNLEEIQVEIHKTFDHYCRNPSEIQKSLLHFSRLLLAHSRGKSKEVISLFRPCRIQPVRELLD